MEFNDTFLRRQENHYWALLNPLDPQHGARKPFMPPEPYHPIVTLPQRTEAEDAAWQDDYVARMQDEREEVED